MHRMIPCYGTYGSWQLINNKSIQEEYKICVLVAEAYGYVVFRSDHIKVQRKESRLPPLLNWD